MKKTLLACALAAFAITLAPARAQDSATFMSLTPAVTAIAANTTNATAGTVAQLARGQDVVRLFVTGSGVAATTNGALKVRLSVASGSGDSTTNAFTLASESDIYVTLSTVGTSTNTASDWFNLRGCRFVRVGQIENTFAGPVSNIAVRLGYGISK